MNLIFISKRQIHDFLRSIAISFAFPFVPAKLRKEKTYVIKNLSKRFEWIGRKQEKGETFKTYLTN